MKKLMIGVAVLLFAFAAVADTWTDPATGIEWTYTVKDGEATVGTGSSDKTAVSQSTTGAITIPSTLGGCSVISIGAAAFYRCYGLTSVTIPDSVTSIGTEAFEECSGLESVTIPKNLTDIGDEAFAFCEGLMSFSVASGNPTYRAINELLCSKDGKTVIAGVNGDVTIPAGVTSIGDYAFFGCENLRSVVIPDSVTSIENGAFAWCGLLKSLTIPKGVRSIGKAAFDECWDLTYVEIPKNVINIEAGAFSRCGDLTYFSVAKDNPAYCSINGLLCSKDGKCVLEGVNGDVRIPAGVTSIRDFAFDGRYDLTSVAIPAGVTDIGVWAFGYCDRLTSVTIPDSVMKLGAWSFFGCEGLTSVTIPNSVTVIWTQAFEGCSRLASVTISPSVTNIYHRAFYDCKALKTVYVAKGDTQRVKKMLEESHRYEYSGFDISSVTFVENLDPAPGSTPTPTPEPEEAFKTAHTFNGLVTDEFGMCGMIQVATARKSAKGSVKVSGFVMLEDGKKQSVRGVTAKVSGGKVEVSTKVGKTSLSLTITDDGFTGTLGDMAVASAEIGEETGIISGTLKMSYFDAKTNKIKTKNITIKGLTDGGVAEGTATVKGKGAKVFEAKVVE